MLFIYSSGYRFRQLGSNENVVIIEQKLTRIIEGKWTIIHNLNIEPINENLNSLQLLVKHAKSRDKNNDLLYIYERIDIILQHIAEICKHLNIQSKNRVKRGLFNGLGIIIKYVTGNLDDNDLGNIQHDLQTLRIAYNKQISITDETLEEFNKQLANITNFQNQIGKRFNDMVSNKNEQRIALSILLQSQTLQEVAERLATAITFAEHKMYHYSIIQSQLLQDTIKSIPKDKMISSNLNDVEQFISVESKIINNIIYFMINIPLVKDTIYNTRKIIPIIHNNPSCSYPVMRKVTFAYNDSEIYEVNNCIELKEFICKQYINVANISNCETEILYKKDSSKCEMIPMKCPKEEIIVISNKVIYMYFNKTTEIRIKCNKKSETIWTIQSNILYGENCELSVSGSKVLYYTKESTENVIIAAVDLQTNNYVTEMELTYDASKISTRLKNIKQMEDFKVNIM